MTGTRHSTLPRTHRPAHSIPHHRSNRHSADPPPAARSHLARVAAAHRDRSFLHHSGGLFGSEHRVDDVWDDGEVEREVFPHEGHPLGIDIGEQQYGGLGGAVLGGAVGAAKSLGSTRFGGGVYSLMKFALQISGSTLFSKVPDAAWKAEASRGFVESPDPEMLRMAYYYSLVAAGVYNPSVLAMQCRNSHDAASRGTPVALEPLLNVPESNLHRPAFDVYAEESDYPNPNPAHFAQTIVRWLPRAAQEFANTTGQT